MHLERKGVPTATLVTHVFEKYASGLARMQGLERLPLVVLEHPVAARPHEVLRGRIQGVRGDLIKALVGWDGNAGGAVHE